MCTMKYGKSLGMQMNIIQYNIYSKDEVGYVLLKSSQSDKLPKI